MSPRRLESGFALLDAIVALTILATGGLSLAHLVSQANETVRRAAAAEAATLRAAAFLEIVALWPREDLDRHLGERRVGAWRMMVLRPQPALYYVALADSANAQQLVRTTLYRPERRDAP